MARDLKDSGVNWIGYCPSDWALKKLKFAAKTRNERYEEKDGNLKFLALENVKSWTGEYVQTSSLYNKDDAAICRKGDVVFGKLRPYLAKAMAITEDMCCSSEFAILSQFDGCQQYLKYLVLSHGFVNTVDASTYGTKMPRANIEFIKNVVIPIPPIDEQKRISGFLDAKCSRIDSAIEKTKKSIDEYKALKKSIISNTVTKGLNPKAEMKDSGVSWIGLVSKEAEIIRLKFFSYMKGRIGWQGLKSEDFIEKGPFCVTGTDFRNGHVDWNRCYHVSDERYAMDSNIQLKVGDLLVTKDGTIGKLAIIDELPDKACLNSHLLIVRPLMERFSNKYLYYVLQSDIFERYYREVSSGTTMESLSQEKMGEFSFPCFSMDTQEKIISFLDSKCFAIDKLIEKKQQLLKELENYKKSLIYEYVTGKKEVI